MVNKILFIIFTEVNDEKLKDMLIPYGNRIKILKKIKEYKINVEIKNDNKPKTNFDYDQLPEEADNSYNNQIKISNFSNLEKEKNFIENEDLGKKLFHQAVVDFVNENRSKFDKNGEKILYLNEIDDNNINLIQFQEKEVLKIILSYKL